MIYKNKRIKAQLYNFGGGQYGLFVDYEEQFPVGDYYHGWGYIISPMLANVTTKDLKEGFFWRLFSSRLHVSHMCINQVSKYKLGGSQCSFKSMPQVWQDLFEPILDAVKDGKWGEFDIDTLNNQRRELAEKKENV